MWRLRCRCSSRQTTRSSTSLRWLLQQRVLRAQHVLSTTDLDIDAVARACGFTDGVALRPHFRRLVGVPPQSYRASFRAS